MTVRPWFPTLIYDAPLEKSLDKKGGDPFRRELLRECLALREMDEDGRAWCEENYPGGYTSYGSMGRLHRMSSTFGELRDRIDRHVRSFARSLEFDLDGRALEMTDCWVNVMDEMCAHPLHLHPTSTVSGTFYVKTPKNASSLRFEDPRLASFMARPPHRTPVRKANETSVRYPAKAGNVILFESWLRHEVAANRAAGQRVSISFNYNWF